MNQALLHFLPIFAAALAVCSLFYTLHFAILGEVAKGIGDYKTRYKYNAYSLICAVITIVLAFYSKTNI